LLKETEMSNSMVVDLHEWNKEKCTTEIYAEEESMDWAQRFNYRRPVGNQMIEGYLRLGISL
jgi:hypothetical protein